MSRGHLIIIGASARAAAQSALRAGYSPWCIDLFADRDLQAIAPVKRCPREQWPVGVLALLNDAPPGPVLLTGAMENHLEVVRIIEQQRELLTGPASAMVMLRSPRAAYTAVRNFTEKQCRAVHWREAIAHVPALFWDDDLTSLMTLRWLEYAKKQAQNGLSFLIKPRAGAGGKGISHWTPQMPIDEGQYLQRQLQGQSLSATYWCADERATLEGITEQIIGDTMMGAPSPFTYIGNIHPAIVSDQVRLQFQCAGNALEDWSGFKGVMGIDAVLPIVADPDRPLNGDRIHIVDINPRYPASAELIERASPKRSVLGAFVADDAGASGMPHVDPFLGKAIVYAQRACRWTNQTINQSDPDVADIPQDGALVEKGQPICTVFAQGETRDACLAGLRDKAQYLYTRLEPT